MKRCKGVLLAGMLGCEASKMLTGEGSNCLTVTFLFILTDFVLTVKKVKKMNEIHKKNVKKL